MYSSIYNILLLVILILTFQAGIVADWTPWSACSKPCDVGIQSRTRLYDGENRTEEQYCNLQYCPDKGVSCYGGRFSCTQFSGYADCIDGQCVCTLGRNNYGSTKYYQYYNTQNCFPEVGNCIIRENPPFALAKVETLDYGSKLRSCVTNDNPNYESM
ncbi:hemicentin-1 isoform X2 [Magallana gigas]|uniref:hemicentin-1 isoform X2 n=1 Tax=Magallana gigas TaxID=29159 RepID=UPI00333ECBC5